MATLNIRSSMRSPSCAGSARGLRLVELDRAQLRAAAQLRTVHRLRAPDALQLAAALSHECATFLPNDRALPELPGTRVVQLKDYLPRRVGHRMRRSP